MSSIDFTRPRRMSLAALVIIPWELIAENPVVLLGAIIIAFRKGVKGLWLIPILLGISIISALWRFFTLRYWVEDGILYTEHNYLVLKKRSSIPIDRIHNISEKSNFLYQMTDMVKLKVDSTASQHFELELILTLQEAEQLRNIIAQEEQGLHTPGHPSQEATAGETIATEDKTAAEPVQHIIYSTRRLLGGIVTQSHARSMIMVGTTLLALANELMDYVIDNLHYWMKKAFDYSQELEDIGPFVSPGNFLLTAFFVYLLLVFVWTLSHLIMLWGTRVSLFSQYISYSAGLITNRQKRIRAGQIIAMSFKSNPLERLMGQCTLRISQAENIKKEEKEMGGNGLSVFGWREQEALMQWWGIRTESLSSLTPSKKMLYVRASLCLMLHLIAGVTLLLCGLGQWLIVLVPTLILGLWWAVGSFSHRSFILTPRHLYIRHGGTAERRSWVPYGRIDKVNIVVNPIQRMSGRCRLVVSAMDEQYSIAFIRQTEASAFRDQLLYLMER